MDTHNGSWRRAEWTQTCTHNDNDSESKLLSQHGFITTSPFWTPDVMKCRQLQFFQFSLPCIIHPSVQKSLFVSGDSGVCLSLSITMDVYQWIVAPNAVKLATTVCTITSLYIIGSWSEWSLHTFARVQSWLKCITYVSQCLTYMKKNPLWRICPFNFKPNTTQRHQTGNIKQQQMETSS